MLTIPVGMAVTLSLGVAAAPGLVEIPVGRAAGGPTAMALGFAPGGRFAWAKVAPPGAQALYVVDLESDRVIAERPWPGAEPGLAAEGFVPPDGSGSLDGLLVGGKHFRMLQAGRDLFTHVRGGDLRVPLSPPHGESP